MITWLVALAAFTGVITIGLALDHWFNPWWERKTAANPRLALADQTFDQSHMQHTLIVAAIGAAAWAAAALLSLGTRVHVSTRWLGVGLLVGIAFYLVREIVNRIGADAGARMARRRKWDGLLDVLVPFWVDGTFAIATLTAHVPTWLGLVFVALAAGIGYAYTFGRPAGALYYDGSY